MYELNSTYTFFEGEKASSRFEVPILNTYSDQWWIPFHVYGAMTDAFYYVKPKYSGDFINYDGGYELVRFDVSKNEEVNIFQFDEHVPMLLSPNEDLLLFGNRFESILHLNERTVEKLVD